MSISKPTIILSYALIFQGFLLIPVIFVVYMWWTVEDQDGPKIAHKSVGVAINSQRRMSKDEPNKIAAHSALKAIGDNTVNYVAASTSAVEKRAENGAVAEIDHNSMDTNVNVTSVSAPQVLLRGLDNTNNATMNTSVRNRTTATSSRRPRIVHDRPLLRGGKDPMDAKFLKITNPGVFLYLYSAFWDDRDTLPGKPVIRIITVTKTIGHKWKDIEKDILPKLRCVTVCRDDLHVEVQGVIETLALQFHPPEREIDRRQIICVPHTCRDYVTVTFAGGVHVGMVTEEWVAGNMLPVETYQRPKIPQNLVVCVPPLHNTFDVYRVVEWFEMLKLLGVDKVVAYNESLDETASRIMRHYQDQGYLDVWQMDPDYLKPEGYMISRWRGPVSMSDCMYRYMYRYKRVLGMDVDEFIIPRTTQTLPQLIDKLESNATVKNGTVRLVQHSFVASYFIPNISDTERFTYLRHNYRLEKFEQWHKKSIVNPLGCLSLMNHYCHEKIPGFEEKKVHGSDVVMTDIGFVHHYRNMIPGRHFSGAIIRDNLLLRYASELTKRVLPKLKELGL